jgi:hypothetical protein
LVVVLNADKSKSICSAGDSLMLLVTWQNRKGSKCKQQNEEVSSTRTCDLITNSLP